ncbi:hypothetical protein BG004_003789 [Podila humilis]|nr:hypothetical protein BG004_003789 [Podila humilis]
MHLKTFIGLTLVATIATTVNSAPACPSPKAFCDSIKSPPLAPLFLPAIPEYTKLCSANFVPDATCNKAEFAELCRRTAQIPQFGTPFPTVPDYSTFCLQK